MIKKPTALCCVLSLLPVLFFNIEAARAEQRRAPYPRDIYLDVSEGTGDGNGSKTSPLKSIPTALALVPDPVTESITIHIAPGVYGVAEGVGMTEGAFELRRRMRARKAVRMVGEKEAFSKPADLGTVVFDWATPGGAAYMVMVTEGNWYIENIQLGTRRRKQRQGFSVTGPAKLRLRNVRVRVRSFSGAGLHAHRAGRIELLGRIEINEDLHDKRIEEESFAGIIAEDHGSVKFMERKGSSLSMGNGSLSASYWGAVQLGCEWAKITSWGRQSNIIAVNNSGRVDLHGTTTRLIARQRSNTPLGLEDDGHVLAEGARIIIPVQEDQNAIILQKASTLFCNDVEIQGKPKYAIIAYSGSLFVGGFIGDLGRTFATTGGVISVHKCTGRLLGPFETTRMGKIALPDGREFPPAE